MNRKKRALLFACAIMAVTLICSSLVIAEDTVTNAPTPTVAPNPIVMTDANYLIAEEDVLRMDVWGEMQLSNIQMQVTPDGKINVAYIGEIQAAGLTQSELTANIAKKLEEAQILILPKVVISLITLHRPVVRVLGAVQKTGEFQFKEGKDRIYDAIAQAGYVPDVSWLEKVTLTRKGVQTTINMRAILDGDFSQNIELEKGDVINIPSVDYAKKFYVMGQVNRPMMYDLKNVTKVLDAINLAGGITERASLASTIVIRGDLKNPQRVKCDVARMLAKADLSQNIELQPGDVVYVPETSKPNWNKISQILSTISSLTYIRKFGLF